ncbi:hypothetical protein HDU90_008111 [Geranomyces variabilis]|nr:hypothetical protein HDU90_008111 [Geranomyces variabilis]
MVCTARQSFSAAAAQQSITLNPVTLASFPLAGPIAASGDPVYLSFLSEIVMAPNEFSPLERRCGCLNDCLVVLDVSELARQIDANMRPVANNVALIPSGMAVALAIRVVLTAQILAGNAAALKAKSLELKRHRLRLPHKARHRAVIHFDSSADATAYRNTILNPGSSVATQANPAMFCGTQVWVKEAPAAAPVPPPAPAAQPPAPPVVLPDNRSPTRAGTRGMVSMLGEKAYRSLSSFSPGYPFGG